MIANPDTSDAGTNFLDRAASLVSQNDWRHTAPGNLGIIDVGMTNRASRDLDPNLADLGGRQGYLLDNHGLAEYASEGGFHGRNSLTMAGLNIGVIGHRVQDRPSKPIIKWQG
jgi:hypothetical protein